MSVPGLEPVELEAAFERLVVQPGSPSMVHSFRPSRVGMLLGADWSLGTVQAVMREFGVAEGTGMAAALGHGLVVVDDVGPVFFESK